MTEWNLLVLALLGITRCVNDHLLLLNKTQFSLMINENL